MMPGTGMKHISNDNIRRRNVELPLGVKNDKVNEFNEHSSSMNNSSKHSKQGSKESSSGKQVSFKKGKDNEDQSSRSRRASDKRSVEKLRKKSVSSVTVHDRRTQGVKKVAKICKGSCSTQLMETPGSLKKTKKQFVRHIEPCAPAEVIVEKIHSTLSVPVTDETSFNTEQGYKARYAVPELYSSLTSCASLSKNANTKKCQKALQPSTLKFIEKKASNKLNFSPDDKLFKDLIDLNINDVYLKESTRRPSFCRKHPKDNTPDLAKIFQPTFVGEYTMWNDFAPPPLVKMKYYDGFAMSKHSIAWEVFEDS